MIESNNNLNFKEIKYLTEMAADYIEEFLDISDIDGDIEIKFQDSRGYICIKDEFSEKLSMLSDKNAQNSLQELTRLFVQNKTSKTSKIILDINDSLNKRTKELRALFLRAMTALGEGREAVALPPMNSYERKIMHDMVNEAGYSSLSEGEGLNRRIIIRVK